jgi:hypothetical protein
MNETFVGDTVKVILKTSLSLVGYDNLYIKYKKPDGTTGQVAATVSPDNSQWLEATLLTTTLDQAGEWTIQAFIEDEDSGSILHGKFVNLLVKEPITIDVV